MDAIREFLKAIMVIQERIEGKEKYVRINPYNPLSYIIFVVTFVFAVIGIGITEVLKEGLNFSLFKWHK